MGRDTFSDSKFVKTIEEEKEAEHVDTSDYFFDKIGEAVPLKPSGSLFDLNNPPSVPLVVAESCSVIFAAHSTGFYVARIGDVIKSAKEWKKGGGSCSVQELSIVDVLIGRVHILALSLDSTIIAASVGGNVYYFWVKSLLAKEQKPFFSCSVGSDNIKDFRWSKLTTFIILSRSGILYRGSLEEPLERVMDNVDAVHFGLDGQFLAVAIKNVLKIFSPEFTERLSILLELKLEITDSSAFRVDCIRWVRSDCIMLGCFGQMLDSTEENYLVRAILSKNGKEIIDASSMLVALCFSDLFPCTVDDILPSGSGPHLMMSYLETRQLAVLANRKNVDQHIMLIGWKQEGDEPAVINIERDTWLPRIELQENGDDNLLLGLCIDRCFACNNIEVKVGDEELKELSPDCLIFCLTHEGKLIVFHFASVSGDSDLPPDVAVTSDKEDNTISFPSSDLVKLSSHKEDVKVGHLNSDTYSCELDEDKIGSNEGDQIFIQNHQKKIDMNKFNAVVDHTLTKEIISGEEEHRILKTGNHLESNSATNANKELGCQQLGHSAKDCFSSLPIRFTADSTHKNAYSISDAEHLNLVGVTSDSDHNSKKHLSGSSYFPNYGKLQSTSNHGNELSGNIGSTIPQNVSDKPESIKLFSSNMSVSSDLVTPLSTAFTEGHKSDRKFPLDPPKHVSGLVVPSNVVTRGPVSSGLGSSTLASVRSATHSIDMPFQSRRVSGKALDHSILSSPSDRLNFEPSTSKKYGNMRDMATELDRLSDSIEAGSFRDICTSFDHSILETLKALFDRCTISKNIADKQVEEIQGLLQNTVHALTRKTYMEGIVKQTSNRQYWDIWDCQNLSSEFELKRQNMMIISQNLINQLIELEKHFNALEMKSYGENSGIVFGCQHRKKESTSSRHIQSLHTVHNAISSQIAAAEQLSDCLSMQMAELSIASPSVDVGFRSQLFEMIGIPNEGHVLRSSHIRKVTDPPINATVSVSPLSTVMKCEGRNNQSGINNHEPETARRRRESLDLNWANFEPSRTTVKRMLDSHENLDVQRSSICTDKRKFCSPNSRISIDPRVEHISQNGFRNVATKSVSTPLITRAKDLSETFRSAAEQTPEKQILEEGHPTAFSSHSFSKSTPHMDLRVRRDMPQSIGKQLDPNKSHIKSFESVILKESYIGEQSELQRNQSLQIFESGHSFALSLSKESAEKISYDSSEGAASGKPGSGIIKSFSVGSPDSSISSQPTLGHLTIPPCTQSSEVSTSFSSSVVPHTLSFPVVSSTSLSKASTSLSTSDDTVKKDSISTSLTSSAASFVNFPNSHLTKSFEMNGSPSWTTSSTLSSSVKSASKGAEHQSQADKVDDRSLVLSHPASECNEPALSSFMESSVDFMKSSGQLPPSSLRTAGVEEKPSESVYSKGQFGSNNLSSELNLDKVILSEFSSCSGTSSNPSLNTLPDKSGVRTVTNDYNYNTSAGSDLAAGQTHEDEMEEEGVSDSVNLSLESLGGLGVLGASSGPNPPTSITAFGPNLFGGPVVGSSLSPTSLTIPSGEIFRPASLSFQPLQSQPINAVPLPGSASVAPGTGSGFGQPSQVGSGSGTHTLGSVLGSFGQSRQLGGGAGGSLPNTFGAQFPPKSKSDTSASGGFSGGFAGVSAPGGGVGFGGVGSGSGGFGGISASSGGFPAAASGGTGFGAFGNPRGSGFSAVAGGSVGSTRPPSELFTQMRK